MNIRQHINPKKLALLVAAVAAAGYLAVWLVPLPERLDPPTSQTVSYDDGRIAHAFLADDDRWRIKTRHDEVDPDYIEALIELEDRRFWKHFGVDPIAVVRAAVSNVTSGGVVSGASTITMQVVRMAEPRPRTLRSKAIEAFRAVQLEVHFSKEEILDMYLNLLPYGDNYEGLETATQVYFGHDASNLGSAEIATLLAIPQAPNSRAPSPDNQRRLKSARDEIAAYLFERDALPRGMRSDRLSVDDAMEMVENHEVPTEVRPMPRDIPHLAYRLKGEYPEAENLETTVDRATQRVVEGMVERHRSTVERLGGEHVAVVVMDHRTGEVKSAVGNFEFGTGSAGQDIAAFDVSRSTGSLMKPFLLAGAIDEGIASPSQRVVDVPVDYGGYRPENYDGTFDGLVRLDDALVRSLNIPFVNLLERYGVAEFLMLMHRLGAEYPDSPPDAHGLSYAVGGVDATPVEIAGMFSAIARRGDAVEPRLLSGDGSEATPTAMKGAISDEAAWMVRDIMRTRDRPGFPGRSAVRGDSPYAWKTGTSMGYRDAWTAGVGSRYAVVVWAGNLDHRPGRNLVGERAAAPLFFDVIEAIDRGDGRRFRPQPEGLAEVEVCSFSGHLPTSACEETHEVVHPRRSVPTESCPHHVELDVDVETGEATTPACRGDRQVEAKTFVRLPPAVRLFFDIRGEGQREIPQFAPECRIRQGRSGPVISSPPEDRVVTLMAGVPSDSQKIPLMASLDGPGKLNWFVDGRFLGRVDDGERLWWEPTRGEHEFVVTDGAGNSDSVVVEVR